MRITESVELSGGGTVTVKELTVAETRAWLMEGEREKGRVNSASESVGALYLEDTTLQDMAYMCDLKISDLDSWYPSDVNKVMEACKRLNSPFFRVQTEITAMVKAANAAGLLTKENLDKLKEAKAKS